MKMNKRLRGSLALLLATVIWGSTFVAQSVGMDHVGPFTFQAARCLLAVIGLMPVIALTDRKKQDQKSFLARWADKKLWIAGILCGLALFTAASLQQVSLVDTDAGKAGFLTALYIVLVPVIGFFLGRKPTLPIIVSIVLAVIGLYMLSCVGVTSIRTGDLLLLGCALAFAVQITLIDRLGQDVDGLRLNCIQCLVVTLLSSIFMFGTEEPHLPDILSCWLPIGYAGILSMGVAYSLQVLGQQRLEPTAASLIMSLESVVAAITGWLILHESMTGVELLGSCLVFAAVVLSQLPAKKKS